jgi:hypothetical protein
MPTRDRGVSTYGIFLIAIAAMLLLFAMYAAIRHYSGGAKTSSRSGRPVLSEEQKAYLPKIEFSDLQMSAAENFLGDTVYYLDGRVTNRGTKTAQDVQVQLTFVDMLKQVVLRDTSHVITRQMPPLKPGETRSFRVGFDHLPADWNQAPPDAKALGVEF